VSAVFSPCSAYRYHLGRRISLLGSGRVVFVMLNPSTANAEVNDPTVQRCCGYAERWGYTELDVVNLFAFMSTDPNGMRSVIDPIGPDNNRWILETCRSAGLVVCAWGVDPMARERGPSVLGMLCEIGVVPHALKLTKHGAPQHPLYLRRDAVPFEIVRLPSPNAQVDATGGLHAR